MKMYNGVPVSQSREYQVWVEMIGRCEHEQHHKYELYGKRGITVCARWHDVVNFMTDMGPKPTPWHQLDRRNNNGNYTPENCRWVTCAENSRNRRNNKLNIESVRTIRKLCAEGQLTDRQIAVQYGVSHQLVNRIKHNGVWKDGSNDTSIHNPEPVLCGQKSA